MASSNQSFGAIWFQGEGAQSRMFSYAKENQHTVYLSRQDTSGFQFASYINWMTALDQMKHVKGQFRNFFEIMKEGEPVKPYLDIEKTYTQAEIDAGDLIDDKALTKKFYKAIKSVFKNEYDIKIKEEDLVWSNSEYYNRFSRHLVIHKELHKDNKNYRILCYKNNAQAKHLIDLLIEVDPSLEPYLDGSVYGRNRSMRLVGSSKMDKNSFLTLIDRKLTEEDYMQTCITWLPAGMVVEIINAPESYVYGNCC